MPAQLLQQLPHRPIIRDRIRHRHNRIEPKHALGISVNHRAPIRLVAPVLVLHIVLAVAVRFPHVNFDAADCSARRGFHGAQHEKWVAVGVA